MVADSQRDIVLAHTAAPPFVRQAARAFEEADRLRLACIGFSTRDEDMIVRATKTIPGLGKLHGLLARRNFDDIPANRQRRHPYYEVARLLSGRLDRRGIVTDRIWDIGTRRFDQWSARQLRQGDIAYGYEYGCLHFFERARQLGAPCIYEIPSAEHDYYDRIMQRELDRFPDLRTPWHLATSLKQAERSKRRHDELALADRVIVYSSHVVDSYRESGFDTSRFRIVPLGAPAPIDNPLDKPLTGPLHLVWAGTFGIRKGAHYLVEALEQLPAGMVRLDIYGSYALSEQWRSRVAKVADFHGPIAFSDLLPRMARAHALILPSLSEAFGMVVTEAMAQGTTVIVSSSVGAADLIDSGHSGMIVDPGSSESLVAALTELADRRDELTAWGRAAHRTVSAWQWHDFRAALMRACFD